MFSIGSFVLGDMQMQVTNFRWSKAQTYNKKCESTGISYMI